MTRTEEIMEKQKALTDIVAEIRKSGLIQDQQQIINVNLATIAEELSDISLSLAMLVDIKEEEESMKQVPTVE